MQYIVYQYDPATGFIGGVNISDRQSDDPFLTASGHLALTGYIAATMTTTFSDGRAPQQQATVVQGGGWAFSVSEGVINEDSDGNFILVPPAWYIAPPSVHDYAVLGHIRSGALDPAQDLSKGYVTGLNAALASAGARTLPGIAAVASPVRTCTSVNAQLKLPAS